ncbi:MAG: nitroreductase family protein, partial [Vicinamibacterales bacterium]|nr:nitroreductase family protein [Vicinamibacterales bacterium]
TRYDDLFVSAPRAAMAAGLPAVSVFLRFSLGLSGWKQDPWSRWSLRVNPSSGNLHPSEGYIVLGPGVVPNGAAGVLHYRPDQHAVERRARVSDEAWLVLAAGLPPGAFFAAITSVSWREAWKYGERAFRYCQHDTGHAIATMRIAAGIMGWHAQLVPGWNAADLGTLLGTDRDTDFAGAEREEPECLLVVSPQPVARFWRPDAAAVAGAFRRSEWTGRASRLSPEHVAWDAVDVVAAATAGASAPSPADLVHVPPPPPAAGEPRLHPARLATALVLHRRSAVAMSGDAHLDLPAFCSILRRLLPVDGAPWDALWWAPRLHVALFVHRVDGLDPGLYILARDARALPLLRAALREDFVWTRPPGIPADLDLFLLVPLDVRNIAGVLSCRQATAADGFFSVAMVAEFDDGLADHGASFYRNLFWEAGMIGQMLYLEAEAAGARGTGIGCYFDDAVHDLFGMADQRLQSLYHFTVGQPADDVRLQTEPGYGWEGGEAGSRK